MKKILAATILLALNFPLPLSAQTAPPPKPFATGAILDSIKYYILMTPGDTTALERMPAVQPDEFVAVDRQPVPVTQVEPRFPEAKGKKEGMSGTVWLRCFVRTDGTVGEIRVMKSDDPRLNEAAVAALKQWRFVPASREGKPVGVWAAIPFRVKQPRERADDGKGGR